jgi:hypothetical protein
MQFSRKGAASKQNSSKKPWQRPAINGKLPSIQWTGLP